MFRKLILALMPIALLAAACGGGDANDTSQPQPTAVPLVYDGPNSEPSAAGDVVMSALNPFQFLGGMGGATASQNVDASLGRALLDSSDLPSDFQPFGDFAMSMPSELGSIDMAARMFASGDLGSTDFDAFGAMVVSAVMALPPEALAELEAMGGLEELGAMTEAQLADFESDAPELGMFADLRLLDASGLGEGGFGMHMEMDFEGLLGAFGPVDEDMPAGIAMDVYAFLHGDRLLMVMTMWPSDSSPGVDSRDLAEAMDKRAAA